MKLAVTIAGSRAKASAFVVWRGFEESVRKAAAYGFDGVELALKDASDIEEGALERLLEENGIEVSCISTGQVFADRGLYFTHPDIQVRRQTIQVFSGLIRLASRFGKTVNIGRARGFIPEGSTREETQTLFVETMREICDIAGAAGVEMILEPVNRYEINFINNLEEGAALLEKVERPNCGLQPDVFHMNIEEARLGESLVRHGKWVRYIHLADSNRYAPGMGHLDFEEVFHALRKIKFDGWASIEILPGTSPDQMAGSAIQYLKPRLTAYNSSLKTM